jgi:DNA-binding CsgD family transcriptional regulator
MPNAAHRIPTSQSQAPAPCLEPYRPPLRPPLQRPVHQLTPRQRQVMECYADDMTTEQICAKFQLREQYVWQVKCDARKRLGCRTVEAAMVRFDRIRSGR